MAADLPRLLRWYPPAWRDRYGDDLIVYMRDSFGEGRPPLKARFSLAVGGIGERIRLSGLFGESLPSAERVRAGALVVLCSWTAFVIAGSSFAKLSEHFDQALPAGPGTHHLPDLAYTTIQAGAGVAGIAVIAGALLAIPALSRFLRCGGWSAIKRWAYAAIASTAVVIALFLPLRDWAHHLSDNQRNGGSIGYEVLFLAWAAAAAATLALWTASAVAAARRTPLPHRVLTAETGLAVIAAADMIVIVAATGLWWATLAERAPIFLNSDPSTPINARLIATIAVMVLAAASATAGVTRIARTWPLLHHS